MALIKKVNPEWFPAENKGLRVGESIEITDFVALVRSGAGVLVDKDGVEQPLPGQKFPCPICFTETENLREFTAHVASRHQAPKAEEPEKELEVKEEEVEKKEEPKTAEEPKTDDLQERRLAALAKARAAKAAKLAEEK